MQSWQVLDGRLHHLLLMMSDCPLAIRHKKGGVHKDGDFVDRGRFFFFFFFGFGVVDCI